MRTSHKVALANAYKLRPLSYLFLNGVGGGLYSPLFAYQDVDAATPAVVAGDTIGRINDVHTATETFTSFYTSDFSAGVDSWTGTQGTAAGNIDSILGRNDCLRLTALGVGGATYLERTLAFFGTTRNRTVISVAVPAAQTYVDGFRVYAGDNTTGILIYDGASSNGAWVDIDVTKYVGSTTIRVYAYIGTSATISALGVGSLMYVRGIVSSYTNLLNVYQTTSASQPRMGSIPKGGRRNWLTVTDIAATQAVEVYVLQYTLSFKGTGTVTLTGASTAGPLVGTGASNTVTLTFTPSAGTLTLTVSGSVTEWQLNLGSSRGAYQSVIAFNNIVEAGVPSILMPCGDGGDFLDTGVKEITPAGDFFAASGHAWFVAFAWSTIANGATKGSIFSKAGGGNSTKTLEIRARTEALLRIFIRGATNDIAVPATNGLLHCGLLVWDGSVASCWIDNLGVFTLTAGIASEEDKRIVFGANDEGVSTWFNGFFEIPVVGALAPSIAAQRQIMAQMLSHYGVP